MLLPHDRVRVGAVAVRFVGNRQQNEASMLHLGRLPKETKSRVVRFPRLRTSLLYSRSAFDAFVLHIHSGFRGCDWMDDFLCHRWESSATVPLSKMRQMVLRVIICSLYLNCVCPIRSLCVSGVLDRVSAGGRSLLRRGCSAAWIIDRPPALLSQRRGESQAARACIQGRRERWHRVGEPKLSLIRFCRGSTCL